LIARRLALVLMLVGLPALAKPKKSCSEKCQDNAEECLVVCKTDGPPKARPYCKQACDMGRQHCEKKCKGKK
jgi:hypothetical protein